MKTAVLIDGYFNRNDISHFVFRRFVELHTKILDIESVLAQGRPNRRCRISLTSFDLKFDDGFDWLDHMRFAKIKNQKSKLWSPASRDGTIFKK